VSATASAQSPAQAMSMMAFSASANSSGSGYSSSDVLMVQVAQITFVPAPTLCPTIDPYYTTCGSTTLPPQPPQIYCESQKTTGELNLRAQPFDLLATPLDNIIAQIPKDATLYIIGWHDFGTNDNSSDDHWLRIAGYIFNQTSVTAYGWVARQTFQGAEPCSFSSEINLYVNLPQINPSIYQYPPTITPTLAPPTITPTATAFVTPTLYPTSTAGSSVAPNNLCSDRSEQWIKDLCLQAWNYLDDTQRSNLITAINNNLSTNFIPLDAWWLQNIQRGIMDVPPKLWQYDSLQQCATYVNRLGCERIVHDTVYLFENMARIGVDWANFGYGQVPATTIDQIDTQKLWFLEGDRTDTNLYWGWVQGTGYACGNNRFGAIKLGFDADADVCWVCQDVPFVLYRRLGYSLKDDMLANPDYALNDNYNAAFYRNVPAVVDFADWKAQRGFNRLKTGGTEFTYQIGESVFTSSGQINSLEYSKYNHVGLVARGILPNMTFEQALDYVLIAQISYSSQGFFVSSSNDRGLNIAPNGFVGRYEVITLRTYLYKHLTGINVAIDLSNLSNLANLYLRHWSPSELRLN
jgi:hypothetical protein